MTNTKGMTPVELRIACAEKCGWAIVEDISEFATHHIQKPDKTFCWSWICRDPQIIELIKLLRYPDYEHDMNVCMELMKKIWSIESMALLEHREGLGYVVEWNFDADSDKYRKYASGKTPQIAIMRAFLEIME